MNFADWLIEEINKRNWNQSELARKSGLTRQAISHILSGRSQTPDNKSLEAIARALNFPADEVMRRAGVITTKSKLSPLAERAAHLVESIPDEAAQEMLVDFLESYVTKENRKVIAVKRQTP